MSSYIFKEEGGGGVDEGDGVMGLGEGGGGIFLRFRDPRALSEIGAKIGGQIAGGWG